MKQFTKSLFIVLSVLFSFSYAFAETGTETENDATGGGSSNAQVNGQSFYIDGTYIAGKGALQKGEMTSKGFKLRTGTDGSRVIFSVNTNYSITSLVINGIANYNAKEEGAAIVVTKVEVDGVETAFTGGEFPGKAAGTSGKLTISGIEAQQSIAIYFDNSNSEGNQINAAWIVNWERPDATQPTITVSPKAINLVPEATTKLAVRVDPNTFTTAWVSDNEAVATVAEDGTVTAVAVGKANIINRWDTNADVADTAVVTVADFDATKYNIVKQFDFTTMGDITLTIEETAAGNIWNEANSKPNPVYFCTNEGLGDISVQAVVEGGKGWSITSAGLLLAGGAGRCAAIGHLKAGQVVEIIYTGSDFFTGSKEDATRKDDGAVKTALNEGVGRAIYKMEEDGLFGFEITKGKAIEKIIVYEEPAAPLPEIVNANFEADEPIATKVCTYAKDVTEGQVAQMQPVTGWTIVENGDARAAGTFAYGSTAILGGDGGNVPAAGPNGETEGKVLGLEAVWTATTQYTQDITLPAGEYLFEAVVYNAAGTATLASNLIGIDGNYCATKNYPVGKWTKDQVKFTLAEEKTVTVSLGINAGNVGNGSAPHLFIDHVRLYGSDEIAAQELAAAKENALNAIGALTTGDALFLYDATAIEAAKAAVNSAETIEAVNAAVAAALAAQNKPAADKEYVITNKTTELVLSIGSQAVTLQQEGVVKFTEVEGGWVLSNNAETPEYIFKTTTAGNTWTLSTTANKDEAYVVNFNLADGAYTIQGANGLFGTDNTTEGSAVYANKTQANNGLWTVAEYVAPEPVSNDYTNYIVNADLKGEGGFDAAGTKGIDGSGIVKAANNAQFDFKQTIANLPAGQYKLTAQAAYRYGADEAAEAAAITGGTETKLASLYATVGEKTVSEAVMNRYDGASETDYAAGNGSVTVNEKFVPNSSAAVQAWFEAGQYVNEVIFNLPTDGAVTIGIVKTAQPEAGDYTVIGPWTLTRLGDAEAEPEPEPEPFFADGKYYIYNNGTKNYLAAGADWGTHAVVNATGLDYTLTQADGKYTMDSQISNGGNNHFLNGEWNDGAAMGWTFAAVEGKKDVYTISNGEKFLTAGENGLVTLADDATAEAAQWSVKTLEARIAELATATAEAPVNATFLIQDANFGRNDLRKSAWTMEASNQNLSGGNNTNNNAESFHSVFTLSQVLTNVPKGVYTLTAQGFYRQDGSDNENLPVFFANDYTQTFPLKTGSENSMSEASNSFSAGNYTIDPIYFQLTEAGNLTVGAKLENNTNLWCIWDNFQLTYYGVDADLEALKNAAIIKELADLRAKAQNMLADIEVDAVKTAIDEALGATAEVSGADAINTAIKTMEAAIEKGEASIIAKNTLPKMKQLTEETNLYTAEALNAYYTQWEVKYLDGSLTKTEATTNLQDPFLVTGWHANITVDNFLLSAWDTNPDFNDAPYYINTWSVEGENDGSEFKVPFFEYWTGDGESLGENKLTATMNNLEAGDYEVTAWVRVRAKNGYTAPAYGITFQANDGENVNAADGTQIGESQFYLKEVSATGTVAEDGVLKIKFNVAADNNISWLSFKNVKFEKKGEEPKAQKYEGYVAIATTVQGAVQGTVSTEAQTVTITETAEENVVAITFSGFSATVPPTTFPEITFNANITGEEALTYTVAEGSKVSWVDGMMTRTYNVTGTGTQASAEATPAISLQFFQNPMMLINVVFAATENEAKTALEIATSISNLKANAGKESIYTLSGQKVEKAQKGLYIINGKKVVVK